MHDTLSRIEETGIVAIMRAKSSDQLIAAADAILRGGVNAIEVTMTTPGALDVIREARMKFGSEVIFGVGSVLDAPTARAAILAGSEFVVTPTLNTDTIDICRRYSIPIVAGAFTPTEVITAWEAGADTVKVFPASIGGPKYLKAILAPLPQVKLMPVGGVNLETTGDFIRAGATSVGVGSALISQKLLDEGDLDALTHRATALREAVRQGRQGA